MRASANKQALRAALLLVLVGAAAVACTSGVAATNGDGGTADAGSEDGGNTDAGSVGPTVISASTYSQACAKDDDCAAVLEGSACVLCACPNAAIAKTDVAAFTKQREALKAACGPSPAIGCGVDCAQPVVSCSAAGKCVFGPGPDADAGADAGDGG